MTKTLRFMFLGDVVGISGLNVFQKFVPKLKEQFKIDAIVANGENAAKNGKGLTEKIMDFFKHNGVSIVTSGNHIWQHKDFYTYLNNNSDVIRPANFPPGCPGKGYSFFEVENVQIAVINLQGRVFMHENLDCPFRTIDSILPFLQSKAKIIFVDFHAEATSEKEALGFYLDGRVSGVLGTHTHVQTADERILPNSTAYISDLGFCGARNGILGTTKDIVIKRFLTQIPVHFVVEKEGPCVLNGVWIEVDADSGKALKIERINIVDE
ncbi:MAG: TIGR00282 family metallophosphoesterase [Candidatus Babeliales bacterium]